MTSCFLCFAFGLAGTPLLAQQTPQSVASHELPSLLAIYKDLHAHPELSTHEERSAAIVANELKAVGCEVTEHVGKYDKPLQFGPLADGIMLSPRLAPQMVGLGLLEAVSEETIAGFALLNGGRPNHVWDVTRQATVLGQDPKAGAMVARALGLTVPARRSLTHPQALRGERLFADAGCGRCAKSDRDALAAFLMSL